MLMALLQAWSDYIRTYSLGRTKIELGEHNLKLLGDHDFGSRFGGFLCRASAFTLLPFLFLLPLFIEEMLECRVSSGWPLPLQVEGTMIGEGGPNGRGDKGRGKGDGR